MKTNIGSADKVIRILIAVVVTALYFTDVISGTVAIVLMILSGILLITSLIGFCPLYYLLGLRTKSGKAA